MVLICIIFCRDAFIKYWVDGNMMTMDTATQVYKILKQPDCNYLAQVCRMTLNFLPQLASYLIPFFFFPEDNNLSLMCTWWYTFLFCSPICNCWFTLCNAGRLQACASWACGNPSRIGIFTWNSWISGTIWYVFLTSYAVENLIFCFLMCFSWVVCNALGITV